MDEPLRRREELLSGLVAARGAFLAVLDGVERTLLTVPGVVDGWSVRDLVAHLAFWSAHGADALELAADGRGAEFRYRTEQTDAMNAEVATAAGALAPAAALRREEEAFERFRGRLGALDPSLVAAVLGNGDTVEAVVRYDGADHYTEHTDHLRAWLSGRSEAGPSRRDERIQSLLDELAAAREAYLEALDDVEPELLATPGLVGEWSARELTAHLGYWLGEAAEALHHAEEGRLSDYAEPDDVDARNAIVARVSRETDVATVRGREEASYRALTERLARADPALLEARSATGESLEGLIREDGPEHYAEHVRDIRAWWSGGEDDDDDGRDDDDEDAADGVSVVAAVDRPEDRAPGTGDLEPHR